MRIGIDLRFDQSTLCGTGVYAETAACALVEAATGPHLLVAFLASGRSLPAPLRNLARPVALADGHGASRGGLAERLLLDAGIERERLDVFWAPTGVAPLVKCCPVVLTIHDLLFEEQPDLYAPTLVRYLQREIRRSVRAADLIIAISDATRAALMRVYEIPKERIRVIHQGLRRIFAQAPAPAAVSQALAGLGLRQPYALALSNHAPHKNTAYALEIWARWRLQEGAPACTLAVAGGGLAPGAPVDLKRVADELGVREHVVFLGPVDERVLPSLYAGARVFLFPSCHEGWGLPPAEAIAMGTPVIVSDRGGLPECVGEAGHVLSLADKAAWVTALDQLMRQGPTPLLRQAVKHRGKELLRNPASEYLHALQSVAPGTHGRSASALPLPRPSGISGCTIVRDAVRLGYPLRASVASYAPVCDEVIICWDPTSTDGTAELVRAIAAEFLQVRLVESRWDLANHAGGSELARQTQLAFDACRFEWTLYVQADEALHERHHDEIRRLVQTPRVGAVSFWRRSFLGTLVAEIPEHRVRGLVRLFRTGHGRSAGDAMHCTVDPAAGRVVDAEALLFNYSRLGDAEAILKRCRNLHQFYHASGATERTADECGVSLATVPYEDSHPGPVEWEFRHQAPAPALSPPARHRTTGFSILIPSFNDLPYLKLLLESIRRFSEHDHEVVVVTDGSTDGTLEYLAGVAGIKHEHLEQNQGICLATNRAAALATREYLFLANSDMVVGPGWDSALLRHAAARTAVSATCIEPGLVTVATPFHRRDCGTDAESFSWEAFTAAVRELREDRVEDGVQYPFLLARAAWEDVGGLDGAFSPGPFSDPDLFYRLALNGVDFVRTRKSLLYHFSGVSLRRRDPAKWRATEEAAYRTFQAKWGEPPAYTFGAVPRPGPEARARAAKGSPPRATRTAAPRRDGPRVSVHIIARETDELGVAFFRSCLESLRGYADQIVIVDNGCRPEGLDLPRRLDLACPVTIVPMPQERDFSRLRNAALAATESSITHIHKIDTDEVYFPDTLVSLKVFVAEAEHARTSVRLIHLMIEPSFVESIQDKEVVFRRTPDLRWEGAVHESANCSNHGVTAAGPAVFLHLGYCRPQWQTMLKWLQYAVLQEGSVSPYEREYVDGVRVPWFRAGRTPDTILEARRPHLQRYDGVYPPSTACWLEDFAAAKLSWREWIAGKTDSGLWRKWQDKRSECGCWEDTLTFALSLAGSGHDSAAAHAPAPVCPSVAVRAQDLPPISAAARRRDPTLAIACLTPPRHDFLCAMVLEGLRELRHHTVCSTSCYAVADRDVMDASRMAEFCSQADLILVFSNTDYRSRRDFLLHHALACRAVYVDGSDLPGLEDPEAPALYAACFKRELRPGHDDRIWPLPFAVQRRSAEHADRLPRDINVSCTIRPHSRGRADVCRSIEALGLPRVLMGAVSSGDVVTPADDPAKDEYYRVLARSRLSVSFPGSGWDTARFWEILGSRSLLLSPPVENDMPAPFVENVHFVAYRSPADLQDKIRHYLVQEQERQTIVDSATEHVRQWHTTAARAS